MDRILQLNFRFILRLWNVTFTGSLENHVGLAETIRWFKLILFIELDGLLEQVF